MLRSVAKKKQRINNVYKRAQTVLNIVKQKLTIKYSNNIFQRLFPNAEITKAMLEYKEVDSKYKNTLTFKDLKMSKDDIIRIFIAEGILPKRM